MRRLSPLRTFLVLAAVAAGTASCGDSAGTYVRLTFQGTVSAQAPIQRILIDLQLGDRPATAEFTAPDKGDITLPKTAVLEIGSGDGAIAITARALSQTGILLGTGQGQGTVVRGQTTPITITFGAAFGDAGVDGPIGIDGPPSRIDAGIDTAGWDGPVDRPLDSEPALDGAVLDVAGSVETGIDLAGRDVAVDAPAQGGVSGTGGLGTGGLGGGGTGGSGSGRGGAGGSGGSTGTGGNPGAYRLIVDPPSMDFGVLVPGTTSPPQTITITNAGDLASPPLVTWVSDQTVFPVKLDTCTGIALSPGGTCTASFAFSPGGQGDFRADGSVAPATETGAKFQLSGTGAGGPATLSLSPSNLNLGMVDVGAAVPTTFTLTNGGDTGAGTIGIQLAGPAAFQIGANTCANTQLGPRSQCTFVVTFAPTTFGPVSATVTAQSSLGLTANASLTATARDFVNLTIAFQGTGAGEVTGGPQNCPSGAPCSFAVPRTDPTNLPQFVLTAQPNELSVFKIWGGACSGSGPCTVVMSGDRSVVADFEPRMVTINLTVLGLAGHVGVISSEDGIIECSGSCPNLQHPATTELILLAKPISSGGTFAAWTSGPCRGTEPKCTIPLLDPVSITATFGPRSYMFVTSTTLVPGMLGGVAAADEECKNLAGQANLPGSYAAWLSTSTMNANTRIGNGGWIRVDGRPFGRDIDALANPTAPVVYYPPRVDEKGNDLGNVHIPVATGSKPEGVGAGSYCKDYADPNGSLYVGEASSGAFAWGGGTLANSGCGLPHRLYCFRKDLSPGPIKPPPQDGRRVFVTTKPYVIADGSTPDEWCMKDADAYRLPNPDKFSAFVATTTMPAINRVRLDGPPWKRLDEVFLTQQPDDLPGGKLLAPIDLASDAKTYTNFMVWSGAKSPTDLGESGTCGNWSPNSPSQPGMVGDGRTSAFPDWFQVSTLTCSSTSTHLMCFER